MRATPRAGDDGVKRIRGMSPPVAERAVAARGGPVAGVLLFPATRANRLSANARAVRFEPVRTANRGRDCAGAGARGAGGSRRLDELVISASGAAPGRARASVR